MEINKNKSLLSIGLILICSVFFSSSSVAAEPFEYEGFWKGTTNQDYDVELLLRDNKVTLKLTMYLEGNTCTQTTTTQLSNFTSNGDSFSISSSGNTYTGTFNYDLDQWEGTWSYSFNTGYPIYCSGSGNGTWTASGRVPRISISPESFEELAIINFIASPGTYHWPTGLTFDGTYLWNADRFDSLIYKIDTEGNIIDSFDSPSPSPTGLTFDGTYLWNADSLYDEIYKLDISGNVIASFNSPGSDPYGLTFDGTYLWNADDTDAKIYKLDTSGNIIHSFDSPGSSPYGLAFDGTCLWNSDNDDAKIYKLDTSGNVIASFDSPGSSPYGLAFDGTYLWNTNTYDDEIYKLELPPVIYLGLEKTETFTITNLGSADLSIDSLTISGLDQSEFNIENDNCSGQTLGTFDTCTFNAELSPTLSGAKSANLEIPSNDPDTPALNMLLSGSVVEAPSGGVIQFDSVTYDVDENAGTATITVSRLIGSDGAVSVYYATSDGTATEGDDYTGAGGSVNWADGDSSDKTFSVDIIDNDIIDEEDKTINLALSDPAGGAVLGSPSAAVLIIINDDFNVIEFSSGWNLISLEKQPANTLIDNVLGAIYGKYISVWAYVNGSWKVYDPTNPGFSDLTTMEAGTGYWINMSESATLTVSGSTPSNSVEISTGWNLVGYNSENAQDIANALDSIEGKYISVWAYMDGVWKVYDPANPGFSDLLIMEPGYGYWINANQACIWTLP